MACANAESAEAIPAEKGKRGSTRGVKWKKVRDQKRGPIEVEIPECFRRVVGDNAQQFLTETSYLVKQYLPVNVRTWAGIPKDSKAKLMNKVKEMYLLPDGAHVDEAIRLMLMSRHRVWRYNLRLHYLKFNTDKERLAKCPKAIDLDQWKWLVEYWGTAKFRRISEANKENQKKQKMPSSCGTISFVRILHDLQRNDNNNEDNRPEYIKLFLKERKKKNGEWSDNEAELAFNKLQELHKAQVEEFGVDNLTTKEAYTRVFGHKSGYVRGLGQGPLPLKRLNQSGQNTSENYVNQADLKSRIQTEVEQQVEEISKKKDEETNKRFAEFAEQREAEIREQVHVELEVKLRDQLRAEMHLLWNNTVTSFQGHQSTPTIQASNPRNASKRARSDEHKVLYNCACGLDFTEIESYMVHLRSTDHLKRMQNVKSDARASSAANINATIRRMKQEKK